MTGLKIIADFIEKELQTEDTNDYSGLTPPAGATQIGVNYRLISPAGITTHNNTSTTELDMYPDSDPEFAMNLLLDSASAVVQGTYQLRRSRYWVDVSGEVVEAIDVVDYEVDLDFVTPTPALTVTIDYFIPLLKSVDATNYVVGGVTPTMDRENKIIPSNALDPVPAVTTSTGPVVQTSVFGGQVGGLEYVFELSNELLYTYPAAVPHTNVSGTSPTTQTSANDALYVVTEIYLKKKEDIDNPQDVCTVFCALKKLYDRYIAVKCSNAKEANNALTPFLAASAIAQLMRNAFVCGKTSLVGEYRDVILILAGSTDDCDCCGEDGPTIIQGLGMSGDHTIVIGTAGETTVSFDGSNTYQVGLAPAVLELINALTFDIDSPDDSITITSDTVNGVTTFYLSAAAGTVGNRLDVELQFGITGTALPAISIRYQSLTGTVLQEVTQSAPDTFIAVTGVADLNEWLNAPIQFAVTNFFSGDSEDYFITADLMGNRGLVAPTNRNLPIEAEVIDKDVTSDTAYICFRHADGTLITGSWLADFMTDTSNSIINAKITITT